MKSRRERLARLRRLEAFIAVHRAARPWLPGQDPLVPDTAAWLASKISSAERAHAHIFHGLKFAAACRRTR